MVHFFADNKIFIPILILLVAFVLLDIFYLQLEKLNFTIRHFVNKTRRVDIKKFMVFTHKYNDFVPASTQILVFSMLLGFIWKDWKKGMFLIASIALQTTIVTITKKIVFRARPPHLGAHILMTSGSYPSGHSAATLTMALLVPTFLYSYVPGYVSIILFVYLLINALFTAYGRLYLDMHWATDIIGGWILSFITYLTASYLVNVNL